MAARKPVDRDARFHRDETVQTTRSPFERDRDRVLYCDAFRRLAQITQVVPSAEGRYFHNRLTHSLKVAQFGRRSAQIFLQRDPALKAYLDPDVVEAACLIHDIGHPPFGHAAEEELNTLLENDGGFEGNAQSFRVVTRLAMRTNEHLGLNLTRATLNATLKYPWARRDDKKEGKKWGYYTDDRASFEFAREPTRGDDQSLEASIMDWSDDVTYAVHDLQDHYRAGMIPLDQMLRGGPAQDRFLDVQENRERAKKVFDDLGKLDVRDLHQPFEGSTSQRTTLNWFSSYLINRFIVSPKVKEGRLEHDDEARFQVNTLKRLMQFFVFNHPELTAQQFGQRRVIRELFRVFSEAADGESEMGIIPREWRELFLPGRKNVGSRRRLVADLVAGLSEPQALHHHQRLTGIAAGSVLDPLWY